MSAELFYTIIISIYVVISIINLIGESMHRKQLRRLHKAMQYERKLYEIASGFSSAKLIKIYKGEQG